MPQTNIIILLITVICFLLTAPVNSSAQTNNQNIYNKILKQYNHPGARKRFRDSDIEAPMIDVDKIVRQEQRQRARQRPARKAPSNYPGCKYAGQMISSYGCGVYGIQPCHCMKTPAGTLQPR